jgi:hypothetical protein
MRHALALACAALAVTLSCARNRPDTATASPGAPVRTTAGTVRADAGAADEPDITLDDAATRLASQFCAREVICHGTHEVVEPCMAKHLPRARVELAHWQCSPAAVRSRLKECLATIRDEPCGSSLAARPRYCEPNEKCPDPDAMLIPPGAAEAVLHEVREVEEHEQRGLRDASP